MLISEQTRGGDFCRYPNGMLNVAWIAGFIRGVKHGARMFYIQQTNNPNLMLPVYLRSGEQIPLRFKEKQLVRVICHIEGDEVGAKHLQGWDDGTGMIVRPIEHIARAIVIRFEMATVLDIPKASLQKMSPVAVSDKDGLDFRPFKDKQSISDSSNKVRIAGFVHSVVWQPQESGEQTYCCVLLTRRAEKDSTCIPVRYYNPRLAKAVRSSIQCGMRIVVDASYRVCAMPGEIDPEAKLAQMVRYPYLHGIRPPRAC